MNNEICHDCGAEPGEMHVGSCDVSRCANCGWQYLMCGCDNPSLMIWTGQWPGDKEAIEFGWYCKWSASGWVPCGKDDEGAGPDINRLATEAAQGKLEWDKSLGRWVKA